MAFEVKIPAVGESVASGEIAQWHRRDGDAVEPGDVLFTLETDKVSADIEAERGGLLRIRVPEGEEVAIGAVVAVIEEAAGASEKAPSQEPPPEEAVRASASVRRLAQEQRVDLTKLRGTGKQGAITRKDVQSWIESNRPSEQTAPEPKPADAGAPSPEPPQDESEAADDDSRPTAPELSVVPEVENAEPPSPRASDEERITRTRMSPLRRKIATHLVAAQQNSAILTTFNECDMSAVMLLRKEVQESFQARHGVKLGFMSFFIKATVEALRAVPQVNARVDGNDIVQHHYFDIGVAVSTERGLVVPVLRDCDSQSFAGIEQTIGNFAERARTGKILFEDLQGGVFTISNGGIYGSLLSTPILNPPQSGILGMHAIQERPVVVDGQIVVRPMMYLALSYDHRIVDGKEAVTFLVRVKDCIENPGRLLVGA
ncbi:MAG TPA: 2-oxoglutarate dehydrogenase complex dihydrolipoyllysine-residue succinyltransferase [Verrucomicrobiales bacterium]|nr:2-oxoglutarate dehydrogenase complex dihydrolipoyllysine-residue succinyltransferase [Verrucomicrobiales bacterium]